MKKMMNFKSLAMVIAMILSMSVVSCVPEPDGPGKPGTDTPGASDSNTESPSSREFVKAIADFKFEISESFLQLYDVVSEVKIDDKVIESKITETNWNYTEIFEKDEIPSAISCKVVGTAKNTIPEFEEKQLILTSSKSSSVRLIDVNNAERLASSTMFSSETDFLSTISSSKAELFVQQRPIIEFVNVGYKLSE